MTDYEKLKQLKKEYQEVPIPALDETKLTATMQRAAAHRRRERLRRYSGLAVAAMLCLVVGIGLRRLPLGDSTEHAMPESSVNTDSAVTDGVSHLRPTMTTQTYLPGGNEYFTAETESTGASTNANTGASSGYTLSSTQLADVIAYVQLLMEQKETEEGISFYEINLADYVLSHYYINEENACVVQFEAGEIASSEHGGITFVIPNEVWN